MNWAEHKHPNEKEAAFLDSLSQEQRDLLNSGQHIALSASLSAEQKAIVEGEVDGMREAGHHDSAVIIAALTDLVHTRMHPGCEDEGEPREKVAELLFRHINKDMNEERKAIALVHVTELLIAELIERHGGIKPLIELLSADEGEEPEDAKPLFLERPEW